MTALIIGYILNIIFTILTLYCLYTQRRDFTLSDLPITTIVLLIPFFAIFMFGAYLTQEGHHIVLIKGKHKWN